MHFDKTCCGTTCDAKANAEYVAKLEKFVRDFKEELRWAASQGRPGAYQTAMHSVLADNYELIKHAQQNHNSNGAS